MENKNQTIGNDGDFSIQETVSENTTKLVSLTRKEADHIAYAFFGEAQECNKRAKNTVVESKEKAYLSIGKDNRKLFFKWLAIRDSIPKEAN